MWLNLGIYCCVLFLQINPDACEVLKGLCCMQHKNLMNMEHDGSCLGFHLTTTSAWASVCMQRLYVVFAFSPWLVEGFNKPEPVAKDVTVSCYVCWFQAFGSWQGEKLGVFLNRCVMSLESSWFKTSWTVLLMHRCLQHAAPVDNRGELRDCRAITSTNSHRETEVARGKPGLLTKHWMLTLPAEIWIELMHVPSTSSKKILGLLWCFSDVESVSFISKVGSEYKCKICNKLLLHNNL